jgi:hypothetical protein
LYLKWSRTLRPVPRPMPPRPHAHQRICMVQVHRARAWRITPASVSWGNSIHPVSTSADSSPARPAPVTARHGTVTHSHLSRAATPFAALCAVHCRTRSSLPTRVSTCIASVALARMGACATSLSTSPIRRPPFKGDAIAAECHRRTAPDHSIVMEPMQPLSVAVAARDSCARTKHLFQCTCRDRHKAKVQAVLAHTARTTVADLSDLCDL